MVNKTKNSFSKILEYLQNNDPEMYWLIENGSAEYAFTTRNKVGVTFLNPQDQAWREEVKELVTSTNPELVHQGSDRIVACVIIDILKTPSEFKNRMDDIPNALGQHVAIDPAKTTGNTVTLKNGAYANIDENFSGLHGKTKIAIYNLYNGEIGVKNTPASLKYVKKVKRNRDTKEKEEPQINENVEKNLRYQIMLEIEDTYVQDKKSRKSIKNIYLETVLSLINYIFLLNDRSIFETVLKGKIIPLISFSNIDFYLIFEPHRQYGTFLVDDWIIRDWYTNRPPFDIKQVTSAINSLLEEISSKNINKAKLLDEIDIARESVDTLTQGRKIPEKVIEIYNTLGTKNSINNAMNVLPKQLADIYAADPHRKLVEDEARYFVHLMFESLERLPVFDINKYVSILEIIAEYLYVGNETGIMNSQKLLFINPERLKFLINPIEKISEARQFVDSSYFLYIPLSQKESAEYPHQYSITKPGPTDERLYHPLGMNYRKLNIMLKNPDSIIGESKEVMMRVIKQLDLTYDTLPQNVKESLEKLSKRPVRTIEQKRENTI